MKDTIKELDGAAEIISNQIDKLYKRTWTNKATQNMILARLENVRNNLTLIRNNLSVINRRS